jgi:hypothetical protein
VYFLYPETAGRTLEDLNAYFDKDSGNTWYIPIGDKVAKSRMRPQTAIDAEQARIFTASEGKTIEHGKGTSHVEQVDI